MFWKAKIVNRSNAPRTLKGMTLKQVNHRFVIRFNLDDGTFRDFDCDMPRFDRGEEVLLTLHDEVQMPTLEFEDEKEGQ